MTQKLKQPKPRQPKQSPGTDALRESMAELEGYVNQGMTIDDIGRHIKQHSPQRVHTYSWSTPGKHSPKSVKKLRASLGLSQAVFGQLVGVSAILVQGWERGVRIPIAKTQLVGHHRSSRISA